MIANAQRSIAETEEVGHSILGNLSDNTETMKGMQEKVRFTLNF